MSGNLQIIKLSPDQWRQYRDLRLEALKEEPLAFLVSFEEKVNDPDEKWKESLKAKGTKLFAIADNKLVGMVGAYQENRTKNQHIATIWGVYVNKTYRGQGIGRKLMEAVLEETKKLAGIEKIKIGINPEQKAAYELYKSLGFKEIGREEKELKVNGKYYDEILMEMLL